MSTQEKEPETDPENDALVIEQVSKLDGPVQVKTSDDVSNELKALHAFLQGHETAWQIRVAALHRFQRIVSSGGATFPSFVDALHSIHKGLSTQLLDRRSKVVKETNATLAQLTKTMKSVELSVEDHRKFVAITRAFIENIFETLIQTVKVISEAGRTGMSDILENIDDDADHTLLRLLMEGTKHAHPKVRIRCHECMQLLLNKYKSNGKCEKDDKSQEDEKKASDVLSLIEETITRGLADSDPQARTAARVCLIEFHRFAPVPSQRLLSSMSPAVRKLYDKQLEEYHGKPEVNNKKPVKARLGVRERIAQQKQGQEANGKHESNDTVVVVSSRTKA